MRVDYTTVPDIGRGDAGLALLGEWRTCGPEHQQRAADAAMAAWQIVRWPAGLLAYSCLLGEDGQGVLQYSQWSEESAAHAFADADKPQWAQAVRAAAPDIEYRKLTPYRLYRNTTPLADPPAIGCLVTVTVDFDGPDAKRQQGWVDHVFAAAGTTHASPERGMLAAHFHLSLDGTRVINLAEWTTTQAHRDSVASATAADKRFRGAVQEFGDPANHAVQRYMPYRCIAPNTSLA